MTAARKLAVRDTYLEVGQVEQVEGGLRVRLEGGPCSATRAKGCLVAPDLGDTVLCALHPGGCHVVSVLDGADGAPTRVCSAGDLRLEPTGRLALSAGPGVSVTTAGELTLAAADLTLQAERARATVDDVGFFGRVIQARADKVVVVARELDHVVERLTQRLKRAFRVVEGVDQTRAGSLDLRADDLASVRGENTIVSARVLAKVDGEQIHIG